jgi:hypothetical protein
MKKCKNVWVAIWKYANSRSRSCLLDNIEPPDGRFVVLFANGQQVNGVDWTYTATQANNLLTGSKIKAIATDVPGNEGALEITL